MKAKFYICEHCGNLVTTIHNAGVPLVCCGEKMKELLPMEAAFDFMEQAFAESQEMVVFVTELTVDPVSHAFLTENGCERYFKYNKDLLLDHRKAALQQELSAEQRRHGGV